MFHIYEVTYNPYVRGNPLHKILRSYPKLSHILNITKYMVHDKLISLYNDFVFNDKENRFIKIRDSTKEQVHKKLESEYNEQILYCRINRVVNSEEKTVVEYWIKNFRV